MGSPISSIAAQIFLQYYEILTVKHWMETVELIYYNRYANNTLIIFDKKRINKNNIKSHKSNTSFGIQSNRKSQWSNKLP